ncbi:multidrug effflux MFS transporter [Gryllotalpicola ginsengisoli]|uniref:multidrug effflux MFS transporter n=1 Tax=Gryllotalpicola ginsengisoli TaxID=444608 RepID=UPI0003B74E13|nr:multidrug effflux MFS transporter [Gryllotalpicola ginsengisoli]
MTTATAPLTPTGSIKIVHPGDSLTGRQRLSYILILGALTALGPFTMDMYLPSLPTLQTDFDTTTAIVQLTLTATTVGFGVGQLLVGPWSDRVGRRLPLLLATALHIAACLGAALAPNVEVLGAFRFLQGFGAAAGGVVAQAMVRDLFGGRPLVKMLSNLALVNGLAPVLAPVLGSQFLLIMPWRGIFWVLAAYGAFVVLCVWLWIVETLPVERRHDSGHSTTSQRYKAVLSDRVYVGIVLVGAMNFSGLFCYLSSSTFLFQDVYGFSAQQYGLLFAVNSIGIIIGVQTAGRITRWVGPQWILAFSTAAMLLASAAIYVDSALGLGEWGVMVPLWFFICACGFGFPCVGVLAMNSHPHEAGTAASLLGAGQFVLAGLISPIVGLLGVSSGAPMGEVMICTSVVSVVAFWFVVRPKTVPELAH